MKIWKEIRPRLRSAVMPVTAAMLLGYFGYHAIEGDHGLKAWLRLNAEKEVLGTKAAALAGERQRLEKRLVLIKPDSVDPDLLSERTREVLGYTHDHEVILYTDPKSR